MIVSRKDVFYLQVHWLRCNGYVFQLLNNEHITYSFLLFLFQWGRSFGKIIR